MIKGRFLECHEITAKWEGGWSNHKADPGGATMYGITHKVYDAYRKQMGLPTQSVRNITRAEAESIYFNNYWRPTVSRYNLVAGVDLAVYDASVNSGVGRGRKWLLASVGDIDPAKTVKKICKKRLSFMQSLRIWKTFGRGWGRRVADIEAKGVAMVFAATKVPISQRKVKLQQEVAKAKKVSNQQTVTATGTSGGGGATAYQFDEQWIIYGIGAATILVTVAIVSRVLINNARANAYAEAQKGM